MKEYGDVSTERRGDPELVSRPDWGECGEVISVSERGLLSRPEGDEARTETGGDVGLVEDEDEYPDGVVIALGGTNLAADK